MQHDAPPPPEFSPIVRNLLLALAYLFITIVFLLCVLSILIGGIYITIALLQGEFWGAKVIWFSEWFWELLVYGSLFVLFGVGITKGNAVFLKYVNHKLTPPKKSTQQQP